MGEAVVGGQWSVVGGQWSVVGGQWSVVGGQWSVKGIRISMKVPQRLKARRFLGICGIAEAMP